MFIVPDQILFLDGMLCALAAFVIGHLLKKAFLRRRPYQSIEGHKALVLAPMDDSFPSSHAASSIALFVALVSTGHPWAALVGCWAALVTVSRWYLGVHFPTDLLGGTALGIFCGFLIGPIRLLLQG